MPTIIGVLFLTIINTITTLKLDKYYSGIVSVKDQRISLQSDVISGIKSIKYLGWEKLFENKISEKRNKEFKYLFMFRLFDGILGIF